MSTVPPPPSAKQVPFERTYHGDTVIDPYAWLADPKDPETIAYLQAENAYMEAMTEGLSDLRTAIFGEIKARTQETDLSVPVRKGGWWRYMRTVEGQQYGIHCRRRVLDGEVAPPVPEDGKPLDGEEVLLDGNELAAGHEFFSMGALSVSPDEALLAYSTDFSGNERFTLRVKDLASGEILPDEIPNTFYGCAWSADGTALFYVTVDDAWRPYRVWRHRVGTSASDDVVAFEEADERFWLGVGLTRNERYVQIHTASKLTSEVWLLDAAAPDGEFTVVAPRRQGVEYDVEVAGDRLLILHNDGAENFELASAPLPGAGDSRAWTPLIAHRADTRLLGVNAFADYLVIYSRRDGLTRLSILPPAGGAERQIEFPEPIYTVGPGSNPEYTQTIFRLGYNSMVTPGTVYDCDLATGELTLLKQQPVLPSPAGVPFASGDYEQFREWAVAPDGTRVPVSLVCRKGTPRDGSAPCLLYGYGSYEHSTDPSFAISRLPCSTAASSTRSRTCAAAASWACRGTSTASCWRRRTRSPTSWPARSTWWPPAGRQPAADRARRLGRRAADGRGGEPGPVGVRRHRCPGAVRGRAELDSRPVAAADRDRVGGVGRPAARPGGVRVHEVVHAL